MAASATPSANDDLVVFTTASRPPTFETIDEERAHRMRTTALGYRIFGSMGFGQQGDGHISARDPEKLDHFWMLKYGVPFRFATVDDLVLVAPDGSLVEGHGGINMAGYNIHWPVHEARTDIVSAAHTHTPYGTAFSAQVRPFEALCQEACMFVFDQAVWDDEELAVMSTVGGERIADTMGENNLCILRNHGLLTAGTTVEDAVARFVLAERVAEVHIKAGELAKPISVEGAKETAAAYNAGLTWHVFQYLVRDYVPDPTVVD
ncbi:MAG: ribulose-5-phosphate 4-epimerase/fuculose-1-phosphate aldolase [Acidimicrobiales bacterium]|jgi:ribulose-5-phosphate 4-epimerase/fuculose-1-phosphate aldolase